MVLEIISFGFVDVKVEALDLPILVLANFDPLLPKQITIGKLIVGLSALDPLEVELETFGLLT